MEWHAASRSVIFWAAVFYEATLLQVKLTNVLSESLTPSVVPVITWRPSYVDLMYIPWGTGGEELEEIKETLFLETRCWFENLRMWLTDKLQHWETLSIHSCWKREQICWMVHFRPFPLHYWMRIFEAVMCTLMSDLVKERHIVL